MKTIVALLLFMTAQSVVAQQAPPSDDQRALGPAAVDAQVESDAAGRQGLSWLFNDLRSVMSPYYDFKDRVQAEHGLAFGADYNFLFQSANRSPGEDHAAGGIVRLFASWALVGRESGNTGSLVAKVENRHRAGTEIPPQSLGSELGYAGLTAVVYSDAGSLLTNLYWRQSLADDRFAFVAGIVDATDYLDVYGLVNPWTNFANLSFTTDPTIPAPNQGLGVAGRAAIGDNYYVLAGFADANGDPGDPLGSAGDFFADQEYFTHVEVGWIGSRATGFTDNVHLTLWQAGQRATAQLPEGWGATVSFSRTVTEHWMPFARVAYSDGGGGVLLERSASGGLGYALPGRSDFVALGAAWGRPSMTTFGADRKDQYTLETFYRAQLAPHTTLNAAVQLLLDPALNPTQNAIWVFSLSARVSL